MPDLQATSSFFGDLVNIAPTQQSDRRVRLHPIDLHNSVFGGINLFLLMVYTKFRPSCIKNRQKPERWLKAENLTTPALQHLL
jgi:hypothetical protein